MAKKLFPRKGAVINVRTTVDISDRLDALVAKYPLTKHAIARIVLERGLDAIEADPQWFEKAGPVK